MVNVADGKNQKPVLVSPGSKITSLVQFEVYCGQLSDLVVILWLLLSYHGDGMRMENKFPGQKSAASNMSG